MIEAVIPIKTSGGLRNPKRPPAGVRCLLVSFPPAYGRSKPLWWDGNSFLYAGVPLGEAISSRHSALLVPVDLPEAFHLSPPRFRSSILSGGLAPHRPHRIGNECGVYVFDARAKAKEAALSFPEALDLWRIDAAGLGFYRDSKIQDGTSFVTLGPIEAERLSLVSPA